MSSMALLALVEHLESRTRDKLKKGKQSKSLGADLTILYIDTVNSNGKGFFYVGNS